MKGLVGGRGVEERYMHVSKSLITDFGVQSNLLRRPSLKVELLQPNFTGLSPTKLSLMPIPVKPWLDVLAMLYNI